MCARARRCTLRSRFIIIRIKLAYECSDQPGVLRVDRAEIITRRFVFRIEMAWISDNITMLTWTTTTTTPRTVGETDGPSATTPNYYTRGPHLRATRLERTNGSHGRTCTTSQRFAKSDGFENMKSFLEVLRENDVIFKRESRMGFQTGTGEGVFVEWRRVIVGVHSGNIDRFDVLRSVDYRRELNTVRLWTEIYSDTQNESEKITLHGVTINTIRLYLYVFPYR